ncbi:DUF4910 domain-containing protein [bacterium]|nr:DUF4910 domain-containing protein [bacterium]
MREHLVEAVEALYPLNRCLLGEGYDTALAFLKHLYPIEIIEVESGTQFGTWTVPNEWIVRDAWVKNPSGKKITDYKEEPLSLVVGSLPYRGFVDLEELRKHWHYSEEMPNAIPYVFKYYDKDWGFCFPKDQIKEENKEVLSGVKLESGEDFVPKYKDKLKKGKYEVFIDTEEVPGKLKIGVHTIKGKTDREILLFAHLDHPFQANDNLSAVAALLEVAGRLKNGVDHTIKIIFCPETIGSIAYAFTQDLSKVDFVIATDICGNNNDLLLQIPLRESRLNSVAHLSVQGEGQSYRKAKFRSVIGSDEYVFNDPEIDIPAIMLSRHPYPEYHTSEDTPDKLDYDKIEETAKVIVKIIDVYERDYIPVRKFKGPLMRSRFGIQTQNPQLNLAYDYLFYSIDGKKKLSELCVDFGLNFELTYDLMARLIEAKMIEKKNED